MGPSDWKVRSGKLQNNGTSTTAQSFIFAPKLSGMADYVIVVEAQVISYTPGPNVSFGFVVRANNQAGGNQAGVFADQSNQLDNATICCQQQGMMIDPKTDKHMYQVKVQGSQITFSIDGNVVSQITDSLYPSGQMVGLFDEGVTLDVLSFEIDQVSA